jgi:exonuclease VII small subunit
MNASADPSSAAKGTTELTERVRRLENQLTALTEAVEVLTRGLESSPMAEPPNHHIEEAARRAHELLLLAKSAPPDAGPGEIDRSI